MREFRIRQSLLSTSQAVYGVLAIVLAIGFIWALRFGRAEVPRVAPHGLAPPLRILPEFLRFGEVNVTDEFKWQLRVKNESAFKVSVADYAGDCGCVSIVPKSLVFQPEEVKVLDLNLDLTKSKISSADSAVVDHSVKFVLLDEVRRPLSNIARVEGTVKSPVVVKPNTLQLTAADSMIVGRSCTAQTIEIVGRERLKDVNLAYDASKLSASCETLLDGQTHILTVTPCVPAAAGHFRESIRVNVTTTDNSRATVVIPIQGTAVNDVHAVPPILNLTAGDARREPTRVALRSRTLSGFNVTKVVWTPAKGNELQLEYSERRSDTQGHDFDVYIGEITPNGGLLSGELEFMVTELTARSVDVTRAVAAYSVKVPVFFLSK